MIIDNLFLKLDENLDFDLFFIIADWFEDQGNQDLSDAWKWMKEEQFIPYVNITKYLLPLNYFHCWWGSSSTTPAIKRATVPLFHFKFMNQFVDYNKDNNYSLFFKTRSKAYKYLAIAQTKFKHSI